MPLSNNLLGDDNFRDLTVEPQEYGDLLPVNAHAVLTTCYDVENEVHPCTKRYEAMINYLRKRPD